MYFIKLLNIINNKKDERRARVNRKREAEVMFLFLGSYLNDQQQIEANVI